MTNLTKDQIETAAQLLADARQATKMLDAIPVDIRPTNLTDAYAIQDRLIQLSGLTPQGWFGACTNEVIQNLLNLNEPYYAYLLKEHIYQSPAFIDTSQYPPIVFECEFGFVVDRDFTPLDYPYSRESIEQAILTVCPVIEIVAGHLKDWPNQDVFSVIADNGTDGALVIGEGISDWREINMINTQVTLTVNGQIERRGTGEKVLGDPLGAFVWLVNALTRDGKTLLAEQVHNTGTATDIYWAKPGDIVIADFQSVGYVELQLE